MPLVPKRLMIRRSERVRARSTCKAESRGHCHQIGERVSLHLSHHLTPVCLYCDLAEWLRQELDSARLHGLDGHRYVTVTRNKDDRHVDPIAGDAFLQIETIEAWKRNVKYEAARNKDSWAAEKFLRGREYFRQPAF